jgi:uncharacterized protein YlxW (UPF0749 family)
VRNLWRVLVPLTLLFIGMLMATSAQWASSTDVRAERRTELADLIRAEEERVQAASREVSQLQEDVVAGSEEQVPTGVSPELAAVIGEVEGTGLEVELSDAPLPADGVPEGYSADDFVVHEQDVQAVINALWAGGAEAVAVMDQRIVATSAVRCVGSTLLLHGQVYSPPYTVTAVGPVERMQRALQVAPRVVLYEQYADLLGLGFEVDERDPVTVPAFDGPIAARYARAAG